MNASTNACGGEKSSRVFISGYTGAEVCHQYDIKRFLSKSHQHRALPECSTTSFRERRCHDPYRASALGNGGNRVSRPPSRALDGRTNVRASRPGAQATAQATNCRA
jgi:hypothetical protein